MMALHTQPPLHRTEAQQKLLINTFLGKPSKPKYLQSTAFLKVTVDIKSVNR